MGWLFSTRWADREQLLAHLRSPARFGSGNTLLRSTTRGSHHWYLCRNEATQTVFIGLDLMQGRRNEGWGYKDLDESCGPCEVDCPLRYLELASPATGYALAWREEVRRWHAQQRARQAVQLQPGMVVPYGGQDYRLETYHGRRGWSVTRLNDGARFRMRAQQTGAVRRNLATPAP